MCIRDSYRAIRFANANFLYQRSPPPAPTPTFGQCVNHLYDERHHKNQAGGADGGSFS